MNSNWKTVTIGDFLSHRKGYAFKSTQYKKEGHKIARVSDFTQRSIDIDSCICVDEKQVDQFSDYTLKVGDVVIATVGSWPTNPASVVGRAIRIPDEANGFLLNQNAVRLRSKGNLCQKFLFYLLSSDNYQNYIVSTAQGSASQASIKLSDIFSYQTLIPPLSEQEAITSVLCALDDKIENNNKMNETLEEMAQALFKSWFVDFDPVHAKANENSPAHMEAETAQMFPSSFNNDGLPIGWTKKCISDFAFRVTDKFKKGQSWDNEKLINLGRMPSNSIALNDYGEGKELSTSINIFQKDDFLFGSIRPYFCKAGIAPFNGVTNSSVFILRCYEKKDSAFLYALCSSQDIFKKSVQFSKGTKMPAISWGDFSKFEFVNPTENIKDKFSSITLPMFKKIQNNIAESNTLAELRNTLHPKLMSGEIRVKDAEREVEATV